MKNLILGSLSVVLLSGLVAPVIASEEIAAIDLQGSRKIGNNLSPVNLVQLAYQGYFSDLGVPSHGQFKHGLITKEIDAETLVRSAIRKGRLPNNTLNNQQYLDVLNMQLQSLRFN